MNSWDFAHGSRGCGQDDLKSTGGAGLFSFSWPIDPALCCFGDWSLGPGV